METATTFWTLIRFFGAFLLVLGLAYAATRLMAQRVPTPAGGRLRVVGHLSLGGRRGVAMVRHGRRVLILGVTDQQVNLLDSFESEEEEGE